MQKNQSNRSVGSKDRVETDGRTRPIAVPCLLTGSVTTQVTTHNC